MSRMRRNLHVRFLGEGHAARHVPYPTSYEGSIPFARSIHTPTHMSSPLHVLWVGAAAAQPCVSAWGPFTIVHCASFDDAARALRDAVHDAVVLCADAAGEAALVDWPSLSQAVLDAAVLVLLGQPAPELATRLVQRGVQDVLPASAGAADIARALRLSSLSPHNSLPSAGRP